MTTIEKLVEWLNSCKGISNVRPVKVTLDKQNYKGCRYTRTNEYTADMMAVVCGEKKAGDTYSDECIYLLGPRPRPKRKTCYTLTGSPYEWYIGAYFDDEPTEHQPFGPTFMVFAWTVDGRVDDGERTPYLRKHMVIEEL